MHTTYPVPTLYSLPNFHNPIIWNVYEFEGINV